MIQKIGLFRVFGRGLAMLEESRGVGVEKDRVSRDSSSIKIDAAHQLMSEWRFGGAVVMADSINVDGVEENREKAEKIEESLREKIGRSFEIDKGEIAVGGIEKYWRWYTHIQVKINESQLSNQRDAEETNGESHVSYSSGTCERHVKSTIHYINEEYPLYY